MIDVSLDDEALFASLPKHTASDFDPPPWTTSSGGDGFASSSTAGTAAGAALNGAKSGEVDWDDWRKKFDKDMSDPVDLGKYDRYERKVEGHYGSDKGYKEDEDDGDEPEEWEDAVEQHAEGHDPEKTEFTVEELENLLKTATDLKTKANSLFTPPPSSDSTISPAPDLDGSLTAYKSALEHLPLTSLSPDHPKNKAPPALGPKASSNENDPDTMFEENETSTPTVPIPDPKPGEMVELTDEQASALEAQQAAEEEKTRREAEEEKKPEVIRRRKVEREIEDLKKVVWGNLGAVYVKKNDDKEAVAACTEALKIDPLYVKALHRRATASERLDTWTSLTTAQEDYKTLLTLLPPTSPIRTPANRALATLPARIAAQQNKEKDEMLGKLKELGNGLLGKFGMSVDNFKFDPQPGGGYSMRFER